MSLNEQPPVYESAAPAAEPNYNVVVSEPVTNYNESELSLPDVAINSAGNLGQEPQLATSVVQPDEAPADSDAVFQAAEPSVTPPVPASSEAPLDAAPGDEIMPVMNSMPKPQFPQVEKPMPQPSVEEKPQPPMPPSPSLPPKDEPTAPHSPIDEAL